MHRIDHVTATVDHKFTRGDQAGGIPATVITPEWMNAVQEEIAAVVEAAGIPLSKPDNAQLLAAIRNLATTPGLKNKFINGDFDVWQRGTSLVLSAGQSKYQADRWQLYVAGTSAAATYSQHMFTPGQTQVEGEPSYFLRAALTNGGDATNGTAMLIQYIENVRTLAGQKATLSFWGKADATKKLAIEISQAFGGGGSPSAQVNTYIAQVQLTTAWQKFVVTFDVPSIAGKTIGSNGENTSSFNVQFWMSAGSAYAARTGSMGVQTGTFDFARVQIEAGPVASTFEKRPYALELSLCQRYYEVKGEDGNSVDFSGNVTSAAAYYYHHRFNVPKRIIPTVTTTHYTASSFPASASLANGRTKGGFRADRIANATGVGYWSDDWAADAEF